MCANFFYKKKEITYKIVRDCFPNGFLKFFKSLEVTEVGSGTVEGNRGGFTW